jgi:hypothetical protein
MLDRMADRENRDDLMRGPHVTPVIDIRTDAKCARTQVREMTRVPKVARANIREVSGGVREDRALPVGRREQRAPILDRR